MKLLVKDIVVLPGSQCRKGISVDTVQRYAEVLSGGGHLPNIKVAYDKETGRYLLFDGEHTLRAHKKLEILEIDADVEEGDETLATWWAIAQNSTHGLPRDAKDRERAILNCINHPMSKDMTEEDISNYVGTSRREVFRVRQKHESPKTGRVRDLIYEDSLSALKSASPKLVEDISVGIRPMSREEVVTLAGKDRKELEVLIPAIIENKELSLSQVEQKVAYRPSSEDLPISAYINFVERNPEDYQFFFRNRNVQLDITILD